MTGTPSLRLVYLKMRALAEAPQLMLHYAGVPYSYEMAWDYFGKPWPDAKPSVIFKQLPMLVVDDHHEIAQSGSICRFLAPLTGTLPSDPVMAAQVDAVFEAGQELFLPLNPTVNFGVGDDFAPRRAASLEKVQAALVNFEAILAQSGPFFFGDKPYYCDFGVYHHLSLARLLDAGVMDDFGHVRRFMDAIEALSGVADYLQSRPEIIGIGEKPQLVINGKAEATGMAAG